MPKLTKYILRNLYDSIVLAFIAMFTIMTPILLYNHDFSKSFLIWDTIHIYLSILISALIVYLLIKTTILIVYYYFILNKQSDSKYEKAALRQKTAFDLMNIYKQPE